MQSKNSAALSPIGHHDHNELFIQDVASFDRPLTGLTRKTFLEYAIRARDVVASAALLLLLSPLFLVVATLIKLNSAGPVFFRQRRGGLKGNAFQCFKFRTMSVCEDGATIRQAERNDSRVTRVGRFLRKTSLDELPQLINVLRGEMALVGPRPHAIAHDETYAAKIPGYAKRHAVRPGITGLAQVEGLRGGTPDLETMARRVAKDLEYVKRRSFLLDFKILVMTATVFFATDDVY